MLEAKFDGYKTIIRENGKVVKTVDYNDSRIARVRYWGHKVDVPGCDCEDCLVGKAVAEVMPGI